MKLTKIILRDSEGYEIKSFHPTYFEFIPDFICWDGGVYSYESTLSYTGQDDCYFEYSGSYVEL